MFVQTFMISFVLNTLHSTVGFNLDYNRTRILKGGQGTPNSYFGFSIAILDRDNIFIGSPRENDTHMPNIIRPGVVYKCNGITWTCQSLDIDHNTGEDSNGSYTYKHGKNNQWLGATVVVPTDETKGIVACAPRWYNRQNEEKVEVFAMNGICYRIPKDLSYENIDKLLSRLDEKWFSSNEKSVFRYGLSQMGMSGHFTKKKNSLIFGLPGVNGWSGSFVDIQNSNSSSWKYMEIAAKNITATESNYYGYAVTSGVYFGDGLEYYVTGAPRAGLTGKVVGFRSTTGVFELESPAFELVGEGPEGEDLPFNSYYGSTLCSVDVNNDGLDDLLVGAPLFSHGVESGDVGMVFLYLGTSIRVNTTGFNGTSEVLLGDLDYNGRFGSAIASLKDMNNDNYNDVAVGAPYADDMTGAIYIFNGYKHGLWKQFSQKITASSIGNSLMGFGHSFSNVFDLNGDNINDIIVGSYLSDEAVVIYGQPVIYISAELTVNINLVRQSVIRYDETEAYVLICFGFKTTPCSKHEIVANVTLDNERRNQERVVFSENGSPEKTMTVYAFKDETTCTTSSEGGLTFKPTNDILTPIFVIADYEMKPYQCQIISSEPVINRFDGDKPKNLSLTLTQKISFKKDCPDNMCKTDLHLAVTPSYMSQSKYFIIGQTRLELFVNITKNRDPSYGSIIQIIFPEYVSFRQIVAISGAESIGCSAIGNDEVLTDVLTVSDSLNKWVINKSSEETMLLCPFGNLMHNDFGVSFKISLQIPVDVHVPEIVCTGTAFTQSTELVPRDNRVRLTIPMRNKVAGILTGISDTETIFLRETGSDHTFRHTYVFENLGPSSLPSAVMKIYLPKYQSDGKAILYLNNTNAKCGGQYCEIECNLNDQYEGPSVTSQINGKTLPRMSSKGADKILSNKNTFDCSKQSCSEYICTIKRLKAKGDVRVELGFVVDNAISQVSEKSVVIISKATVEMVGSNLIAENTKFDYQLELNLPKQSMKQKLPWWIILLSIIAGILLILILILIMYKCGFFKRQKLEDRQKLTKNEEKKAAESVRRNGKDKDSFTDSENGVLEKDEK